MSDERGAASVLAVSLSVLLLCGLLVVGQLGRGVLMQRRAETAADLSALAGATAVLRLAPDPCAAAAQVAVRNGARLTGCRLRYREGVAQLGVRVVGQRRAWPLPSPVAAAAAGLLPANDARASPP